LTFLVNQIDRKQFGFSLFSIIAASFSTFLFGTAFFLTFSQPAAIDTDDNALIGNALCVTNNHAGPIRYPGLSNFDANPANGLRPYIYTIFRQDTGGYFLNVSLKRRKTV
jgi:hypothetical protein